MPRGLITGLFRATRKRMMTTDNDMGMFRQKLTDLVEKKDTLTEDDIDARVEELKKITEDLPDDEGKAKLVRFLEDFKSVKDQDPAVATEAAKAVADQFEKLDTAAMQDVPGAGAPAEEPAADEAPDGEDVTDPAAEEPAEDADPEAGAEEATEETQEIVEETEAPAEDADPQPEYTLEEIYQFIKKRMAEDAAAEPEAEAEPEDEAPEEGAGSLDDLINPPEPEEGATEDGCGDKEEVVTDHAPRIPITVNDKAAADDLDAMLAKIKRG